MCTAKTIDTHSLRKDLCYNGRWDKKCFAQPWFFIGLNLKVDGMGWERNSYKKLLSCGKQDTVTQQNFKIN